MEHWSQTLEDAQRLFNFLSEGEEGPKTVDIVLAMGGQDLEVADTAAAAFFDKNAQWLICNGGFGKDTSDLFREEEAVLYGRRCLELGVPEDRLILERSATNSGENFCFTRELLARRGVSPRTGAAACKPYMARRAWATGAKQWPEVSWSVARPKCGLLEYVDRGRDIRTVLELMVGDLQRLRVYGGQFQAPVEVPEDVWAAYERLAGAGYDRYVIR